MKDALEWHDEGDVFGIHTRAHFFDQKVVDARDDFVSRNLPMFRSGRPELLVTESDRENFIAGDLIGQPDAVLRHGSGLISLEFKSNGSHPHSRTRWRSQIKLNAMLQCIGGAMVVAATHGRATVAVLRLHNVIYQLDPRQEVIDLLASSVPGAKAYMGEPLRVSISQLAEYCEAKVRREFAVRTAEQEAAAAEGIRRHEQQLRR